MEDFYIPKYGDIVRVEFHGEETFERNYMICIYPDKKFQESNSFFSPPFISLSGRLITTESGGNINGVIKRASESERKELFSRLAELGMRWNPETKQIENIRWIPKKGEKYYYITGSMNNIIYDAIYTGYYDDIIRIEANNCFKSVESAQKAVASIREILAKSNP